MIVCLSDEGPLVEQLQSIGARVRILNLAILRKGYFTLTGILNRAVLFQVAVVRLAIIILLEKIDLVYSNTVAVLVGLFAAKITRRHHVWHVHEIIYSPRIVHVTLKSLMKESDLNIFVSSQCRNCWSDGSDAGQVVLHNGLDLTRFKMTRPAHRKELGVGDDIVVIGMVGRVHYWKGQEYFLKIASSLSQKYHDLLFVLVGDAFPGYEYLYQRIERLISQLGLNSKVINLGYRTDVPNLLAMFDIFVLPSILPDPLPTTVLEAMACSKPVVATAHGGVLEMVVEGETGLFIPYDSAEDAAEILGPLVQSKALRISMGKRGKQRVEEHFSLAKFKSGLVALIQPFESNGYRYREVQKPL